MNEVLEHIKALTAKRERLNEVVSKQVDKMISQRVQLLGIDPNSEQFKLIIHQLQSYREGLVKSLLEEESKIIDEEIKSCSIYYND